MCYTAHARGSRRCTSESLVECPSFCRARQIAVSAARCTWQQGWRAASVQRGTRAHSPPARERAGCVASCAGARCYLSTRACVAVIMHAVHSPCSAGPRRLQLGARKEVETAPCCVCHRASWARTATTCSRRQSALGSTLADMFERWTGRPLRNPSARPRPLPCARARPRTTVATEQSSSKSFQSLMCQPIGTTIVSNLTSAPGARLMLALPIRACTVIDDKSPCAKRAHPLGQWHVAVQP